MVPLLNSSGNWMAFATGLVNWAQVNGCTAVLRAEVDQTKPEDVAMDDKLKGAIKQRVTKQIQQELLALKAPKTTGGQATIPKPADTASASVSARNTTAIFSGTHMSVPAFSLASALQDGVMAKMYFVHLEKKYGQRSVYSSYEDLEKLIGITIPNDCDPTPALTSIDGCVQSMAQVGVPLPSLLHLLFIIAKLPPQYNVVRQMFVMNTDKDLEPSEVKEWPKTRQAWRQQEVQERQGARCRRGFRRR
jgi:hypothetical protein